MPWYTRTINPEWPWKVISPLLFETHFTEYEFCNDYVVLTQKGSLILQAGYSWNGNTGIPLWIEKQWLEKMLRGSAFHDALYQLIRLNELPKETRKQCDQVLKTIWLEDGVAKPVAWAGYFTVRVFGRLRITNTPTILGMKIK